MPFIAGDDEENCAAFSIEIPGDDESIAAFSGAIAQLAKAYNWEETGTWTAPAIAEAFRIATDAGIWSDCEGEGEPEVSLAILRDEKTQNTPGGTFTSGDWRTRDLTTIHSDVDDIVDLSSNQFTLQPGTYLLVSRAPALKTNYHQARIRNITDGTTTIIGGNAYANNADNTATDAWVIGIFVITAAKVFELQHRGTVTRATNGFGFQANFTTEIYSVVEITKVA